MIRWILVVLLSACGFANAATTRSASTGPRELPPAPEGVTIEQNIAYLAPGREPKLDLYLPTKNDPATKRPAIVEIHGGGWVGGDKSNAREFNTCTTLAQAGYVCVSINYEMDAAKRWPTNVMDCKNAVRFLRANAEKYNIDPDHIGVTGGSAGGHLALMVAYTSDVKELEPDQPYPGISDRVAAVVDCYGITNMLTRRNTDADGKATGLRNGTALMPDVPRTEEAKWKLGSPIFHITSKSPPTLILHGKIDTTVNHEQAIELDEALTKAGVPHELMLIEGVGHSFDLTSYKRKPMEKDLRPVVIGFFDRYLKAKP